MSVNCLLQEKCCGCLQSQIIQGVQQIWGLILLAASLLLASQIGLCYLQLVKLM